jgi:F-type H+-transporting ATPase subunit delta
MSQEIVSKRYAKALFEAGLEKQKLDQIVQDLVHVQDAFQQSSHLHDFLSHPSTTLDQKRDIMEKLFKKIDPLILHFLYVVLDHSRENLLHEVIDIFHELVNQEKGRAEICVISPFPIGKGEHKKLVAAFQAILGKEIVIKEVEIDTSLLGGVVVKVGDRIFDGSLKTKLQNFQERLSDMPIQS